MGVHIQPSPMSMCTRGTPPTPAVRGSRCASGKPARTPCREPVDRRSGPRGPEQVLQLDDPLEAALEAAMLVDHRVVHAPDRLFDPGDLAAGRIDGAGGGGHLGPVPEDRPGSVHFLPGPDDGDDLDGSALSLERVPEAAVPAAPRAPPAVGLGSSGVCFRRLPGRP